MSYTKLANSILTSTLWMEDDQTRIVWFALLAMSDRNGEVQASIPGLANIARVSVEACEAAINKFLSPDRYSRTKDDEGRRLQEIWGGWLIINHHVYRELASDGDRKRKSAERQKRYRDRVKRNAGVTRDVTRDDSDTEVTRPSRQKSHTDTDTDTKKRKRRTPPDSENDWVIPERLDCERTRELLSAFALARKDSRKPIRDLRAASLILDQFDDTDHLCYALTICISNGYQGLKPDYRPSKQQAAIADAEPTHRPPKPVVRGEARHP